MGKDSNQADGAAKDQSKGLSRDIAGVFGTRVVWSTMSVISGVLLARWLGPYDRGVLALVLLLPATAVTLAKLGLMQSNIFFINREKVPPERVTSNAVTLALCTGTIAMILVWVLRGPLQSTVLRGVPTWALVLALVRIPLLLIDNYLQSVLQATGRFSTYNRRLLINDTIRLILVVTLIVGLGLGLPAAVASYTFVTFTMVTWLLLAVRDVIPFSLRIDSDLLRRQLKFGARSYVQTLAGHLLLRIDIYMVAYFLTPKEASFYALALHFTELVLEFPHAVGIVLYPKLASSSVEQVHRLTAETCRRMLLVTGPTAAALAIGGPLLIRIWYGKPFAPAGDPLPWAAAGVVMMSLYVILTRNFTSRGKQKINIFAGFLALVLNVALNLYLIPHYGIVGAAVATTISYAVACLILITLFLSETGLSPLEVFVPTRDDVEFMWSRTRGVIDRGLAFATRSAR